VLLGRIIGVHGVRGWVKVHSDAQPRENILSYSTWWLKQRGEWRAVQLKDRQHTHKNVLALLEGIADRDAAEKLRGTPIAIPRSELPATEAGEFYWMDLIGCEVYDTTDVRLGVVTRLFETGANDVMVVRDERPMPANGKRVNGPDILVPWVRPDVVIDIDVNARKIVVDWDPDY